MSQVVSSFDFDYIEHGLKLFWNNTGTMLGAGAQSFRFAFWSFHKNRDFHMQIVNSKAEKENARRSHERVETRVETRVDHYNNGASTSGSSAGGSSSRNSNFEFMDDDDDSDEGRPVKRLPTLSDPKLYMLR
jgi:hypothetical protein